MDDPTFAMLLAGGGEDPRAYMAPAVAPAFVPMVNQNMGDPAMQALARQVQQSPETLAFVQRFNDAAAAGKINPYQPMGPGGRDPKSGLAYSWLPYDERQQLFDTHQHFGPTYDDPILGKLQAMYTEPSKAQRQFNKIGPILFGLGLSAITGGAGSMLLGPLFSAATKYGMSGSLDPKALALSIGMSMVPGALGGIDPALAQAYNVASKGYGIGRAGYEATRGNYNPAANIAANATLGQIFAKG